MDHELHRLLPFYAAAREAAEPLVLAVVLRTAGSTYRKHGAWMLIARDGRFAGLLSGGCLEGDLREHAARVLDTGRATIVSYDMRGPDDALWGIGSGCEGAMDVLLTRIGPDGDWQPLRSVERALAAGEACSFGIVAQGHPGGRPLGAIVLDATDDPAVFRVQLSPPPHVLLLGGGPDAQPVAELVHFLGWRLTVVDHRPLYAVADRFPEGARVIGCAADELAARCDLARIDAAVVMSHHLDADRMYLRALARTAVSYVGLLGPQPRRERLLGELEPAAASALRPRLRAPVGLDIGANSPSTIALAIVAEIQASLAGRAGGHFST